MLRLKEITVEWIPAGLSAVGRASGMTYGNPADHFLVTAAVVELEQEGVIWCKPTTLLKAGPALEDLASRVKFQ